MDTIRRRIDRRYLSSFTPDDMRSTLSATQSMLALRCASASFDNDPSVGEPAEGSLSKLALAQRNANILCVADSVDRISSGVKLERYRRSMRRRIVSIAQDWSVV